MTPDRRSTRATDLDGYTVVPSRRRGDRCPACGGPRHPRLILRQAAHVPPPRPQWQRIAAMTIFMGALFYLIAFTAAVAA